MMYPHPIEDGDADPSLAQIIVLLFIAVSIVLREMGERVERVSIRCIEGVCSRVYCVNVDVGAGGPGAW